MDKDGSILKFSEGLEMVSVRQNIGNNMNIVIERSQ